MKTIITIGILLVFSVGCQGGGAESAPSPVVSIASVSPDIYAYSGGVIANGNLGGRAGLDAVCSAAKPAALTCNSMHAIISLSTSDQINQMHDNYSFSSSSRLLNEAGQEIVAAFSDFGAGGTYITNLSTVGSSPLWITGSNSDGSESGNHCSGMTTSALGGFTSAAKSSGYMDDVEFASCTTGVTSPAGAASDLMCLCI